VVTGASGTGKSAIVDGLRRRLPHCEVFETDLILQVAELGWDKWQDTWLLLAHGIALNGRATVLCGSLQSEQLEPLPARPLVGDIHFCNLDCPDDVLAERLSTSRGALYKTLYDARRKLRQHLDEQGLSVYALLEEAH
jgi:gluconate kinase